jgi:hypothetical protein
MIERLLLVPHQPTYDSTEIAYWPIILAEYLHRVDHECFLGGLYLVLVLLLLVMLQSESVEDASIDGGCWEHTAGAGLGVDIEIDHAPVLEEGMDACDSTCVAC